MQKGSKGMGSHKHAISGHTSQNRRLLQSITRELNKQKKRKTNGEEMFDSVERLLSSRRRKKK